MRKQFYVYILSSKKNGTLYIGVTSDIKKRKEALSMMISGIQGISLVLLFRSFR